MDQLNTDIELIIDEILTLCSPDETLILLANVGNPFLAGWKAVGIFDDIKEPLVDAWIYHIEQIAVEKDIVLVDVYTVFNGPDGNDPVPDEFIMDIHFNQEGHRLVADLHRAVGYGLLAP